MGSPVVFDSREVNVMDILLSAGDRGSFYMLYNAMTDSYEAKLQAKIATFSDTVGGAAFAANRYLQDFNGSDYPGIYFLSQAVARAAYAEILNRTNAGTQGFLSDADFFSTAAQAWEDVGVRNQFPGNLISLQSEHLISAGSGAAFLAGFASGDLGKRLSDFSVPGYSQVLGSDGAIMVVDSTGRIAATFPSTLAYDFLAGSNSILQSYAAPAALVTAMTAAYGPTAGAATAALIAAGKTAEVIRLAGGEANLPAARRGFTEFNNGYTGDVNPPNGNVERDTPQYRWSNVGTSGNDIIQAQAGFFTGDTKNGGSGNDVLIGSSKADSLLGGIGDDIIWGRDGRDTLTGGAGDDLLRGNDDNYRDTLLGGSGADTYYVGIETGIFSNSSDIAKDDGNDGATDTYFLATGAKITSDSDGIYEAYLLEPAGNLNRLAQAANEVASTAPVGWIELGDAIRSGLGNGVIVEIGSYDVRLLSGGSVGVDDFNWADGNIHLDVGRESLSRTGTSGNDELEGTRRADILIGGAGDDEIEGKAGDDELSGEDGNDKLEGGKGNDKLYGDRGDDKLNGDDGNDSLWGGNGNDRLAGGEGNDMLSGNQGDDTLRGGEGMDRLLGGAGIDYLTGGDGRDTFVFHFGVGADIITDFSGSRSRFYDHSDRGRGGRDDDDHGRYGDLIEISSDLTGFDVFADILAHANQVGDNAVIDFGSGDTLTLQHTRVANLHADSFVFI
jgi:Ca2+-binding RTX toxin-like protein